MPLYDADVPVEDIRYFRAADGKVAGVFIAVHIDPEPVADGADEPDFIAPSYINIEVFLSTDRLVQRLSEGKSIHVTLDVAGEEKTSWASPSTP